MILEIIIIIMNLEYLDNQDWAVYHSLLKNMFSNFCIHSI